MAKHKHLFKKYSEGNVVVNQKEANVTYEYGMEQGPITLKDMQRAFETSLNKGDPDWYAKMFDRGIKLFNKKWKKITKWKKVPSR